MKLQTSIEFENLKSPLSHQDSIVTIGSCFSENIALFLKKYLFSINSNPAGIQYNPLSILQTCDDILNKRIYEPTDLFRHNDQWHSFNHHSSFSSTSQEEIIGRINNSIKQYHKIFNHLNSLILTFGTAFVYSHRKGNSVVSNCHKLPQNEFNRELFNLETAVNLYEQLFKKLYTQNPQLSIILTVSPIRHFRDAHLENQISKSHLFMLIHRLQKRFPTIYYFPSYEIMLDELRDYRFYKDDMLHPSDLAIRYIWDIFVTKCITSESVNCIKKLDSVIKGQSHTIMNPNPQQVDKFKLSMLKKIDLISKEYPFLNLQKLRSYFSNL